MTPQLQQIFIGRRKRMNGIEITPVTQIKFTACKHLSYDKDKYGQSCALNLLGGIEKAVWDRKDPPYAGAPTLVQFCNLRGRLNSPTACLCKRDSMCSNYVEFEHTINAEDVDP